MNQHRARARVAATQRILSLVVGLAALLATVGCADAGPDHALPTADDPSPPAEPVKLIFIHHSTGSNWLTDGQGALGETLGDNNYFVSDTNYGWGPNSIGDRTDIPNWTEWFRGPDTPTYLAALYAESGQHTSYTRRFADPGGENTVIMFKSCFPNSALQGNPDDPPSAGGWLTVGHAKYVYNDLLTYFGQHTDKLFVVITAPPLSDPTWAANARAFNQWLIYDWLDENDYGAGNVAVFDFYNVLTSNGGDSNTNDVGAAGGNHHRWWNGAVQHKTDDGGDVAAYSSAGDDHPSGAGSRKATAEFVPLLNVFYHRWRDGGASGVDISAPNAPRLDASPNPFNPRTKVGFELTAAGYAHLAVFDIAGRLVQTLADDVLPAGRHEAVWDGRDASGRAQASGTYLARLECGGRVVTTRLGLVR